MVGRRVVVVPAGLVAGLMLVAPLGMQAMAAEQAPRAMTLDEAKQLLATQNPTLVQARGRAEEAGALLRQATSTFLPSLVVGGAFTRNNDEVRVSIAKILGELPVHPAGAQLPPDLLIQPREQFSASIALRVPIFSASAIWERQAVLATTRSAEGQVEVARQQLLTAVEQSAWLAQAAAESSRAADEAVVVARRHLENADTAVRAGIAIPLTQLQAQTEVLRRQSDAVRARGDRDRAQLALGALLGLKEPVRITLPELTNEPEPDVEARISLALERRPEMKSLQETRRAADLMIDAAWLRLTPLVWATGSAFASDVPYPTGDKTGWRASLEFQWTLYDGGYRYGRERQARAQRVQADAALEGQRIAIVQQVRDAARDLSVARERLGLAEQQAQVAARQAEMAQKGFENGVAPSLDVLDANNTQVAAQVGLAAARAEVGSARAALLRATGELP